MRLPVVDEGSAEATLFDADVQHAAEEVNDESASAAPSTLEIAKQQGFTGSICSGCGSTKMKRNGSCEVCLDCGATSGCS